MAPTDKVDVSRLSWTRRSLPLVCHPNPSFVHHYFDRRVNTIQMRLVSATSHINIEDENDYSFLCLVIVLVSFYLSEIMECPVSAKRKNHHFLYFYVVVIYFREIYHSIKF